MKKRGQITIFIILALAVIAGLGAFLFLTNEQAQKETVDPQIAPIFSFVESCIDSVGEHAINTIGKGGGYYHVDYGTPNGTTYYFDKQENLIPSKTTIEKELGIYVDEFLTECTNNFSQFSDFTITAKRVNTKVTIREKEVIFTVNYPLTIEKNENKYQLQNFREEIPVRLGTIHTAIQEYANHKDYQIDQVCLSCLYEISQKYELTVDMYDYDEQTILFIITDDNSIILDEKYIFTFAGKYPPNK